MKPVYSTNSTREVAAFLDSVGSQLAEGPNAGKAVLDSIKNESGISAPKHLQSLLGKVGADNETKVLDAVAAGISHFKSEHGVEPTADVIEAALQQGDIAFNGIDLRGNVLDSATSGHHDQMSLQPNRAVVAVLSAIAEAIPFASYLPVDIASNQGKLAILSHMAGDTFGDYAANGLMDGTSVGDVYASSSRMVRFTITGDAPYTSKFTKTNLANDPGFCDAGGVGVPVLRGRTIVYVNGIPAAMDSSQGVAANSPISGGIKVNGVDYSIVGTVTVASGAISITPTPDFPDSFKVTAQAFIDYEAAPALIPNVLVRADVYDIYANPWRVKTGISIDASGQIKNELGLDADSEALMAIRTQMAMERHYQALRMAKLLASNNTESFDFAYATQIAEKNRAEIWTDFQSVMGLADQRMANATMDHGITHLYASAWVVAQWEGLPRDLWEPSGVAKRPGIYRAGRLFGKYEVYYAPKGGPTDNAQLTTSEILAVGRSSQVARCPIVLGDAVAPTFLPLARNADLVDQSAMYARDFTVVNPHQPSALGCALVTVSNQK
jgi:hypothetical protein